MCSVSCACRHSVSTLQVADVHEVQHLAELRDLKVLWLSDNPCAECLDYRARVVAALPALQKLDNVDISAPDRRSASRISVTPQVRWHRTSLLSPAVRLTSYRIRLSSRRATSLSSRTPRHHRPRPEHLARPCPAQRHPRRCLELTAIAATRRLRLP